MAHVGLPPLPLPHPRHASRTWSTRPAPPIPPPSPLRPPWPPGIPPPPPQARIEDLVNQNLPERLSIIPPEDLALALHDYVDKVRRVFRRGPHWESLSLRLQLDRESNLTGRALEGALSQVLSGRALDRRGTRSGRFDGGDGQGRAIQAGRPPSTPRSIIVCCF